MAGLALIVFGFAALGMWLYERIITAPAAYDRGES